MVLKNTIITMNANLTTQALIADVDDRNAKYRASQQELLFVLPSALVAVTMEYFDEGIIDAPALIKNLDKSSTVLYGQDSRAKIELRIRVCDEEMSEVKAEISCVSSYGLRVNFPLGFMVVWSMLMGDDDLDFLLDYQAARRKAFAHFGFDEDVIGAMSWAWDDWSDLNDLEFCRGMLTNGAYHKE